MAKNFSVFVNIGGKLDPSLPASIRSAETMIRGLNARMQALHAATRSTTAAIGRSVTEAGKSLQSMGGRSTAAVTAPLVLLGSGAAKAAFEFEKAGNMLEALGDASEDQRKNFEGLANELNKKYPQSLTDIIKTGNEMLKGGFNFDQMKGSIDQTLATAVLGEMTPAEVGNMMARTINSFQLPMKTYQESLRSSQRVSDQMTFAAVKTTASLKDMGEMYRYVGGAASAVEMPLEQASAFAMAFAKNGTVGSEAGVAMRSAIIRMIKPVKPQLAAMGRIGMKLGDYVSSKVISPDAIIASLQADGIDASKSKKEIGRLTGNQALSKDPVKLAAEITKIVQAKLGREGSAIDASTIAQNVQDAVTSSGSKVDLFKFFVDFKKKIEKGEASMGDLASILQGQHFSRYSALVQSDLPALLESILKESDGYTQARYGTVLKGIVGPVYELSAAFEKLSVTLGRIIFPDAAKGLSALTDALTRLSESNPALLKAGLYATGAAVAFGPLALAVGASLRVLGLLATVLGAIGSAATVGLAARLTGVATSIYAVTTAATVGAIARVRLFAAGLIALGSVGGASAVLAALGGSILAFGRAVLLFPLVALRGIGVAMWGLVANPVGIAVTGIVTALAALGLWVTNNWGGIKTFFEAFGDSFMKGLGPETSAAVEGVVSALKSAWEWVSKLLGPIDETGAKWRSWGESAGAGVAAVVTAVSVLPGKLGELAKQGFDALVNFEWSKAGGAIVDAIVNGLSSAGGRLVGAVRDLAGRAVSGVAGALGLGGSSSTPGGAPAVAGARAAGGPVTGGLPYLVGEKGPEIFVPQGSGRIETNGVLNSLSKSGGRSGGGALAVTVDASSIEEAGKTAKTAGTIITASLDTTFRPIIDTTSIDAALGKVSALKTAIGALGQGGGAGEGGGSAGGSGGALAAAVKAGAKAAGGPADASGGKAFGARGDLVAGAKESYDFWREKGLSHAAAAGFAGSEQGENNFKAHGYGDRGAAYGSMMWQGPRRRQILQGMGLNVIGASHRQQLEAAHWEMTKGPDAGARRAWKLAQGAKTPGEAAAIHVDHYERPLDRALNKRVRGGYANAWAKKFAETEGGAAKVAGARALGGPVSGGLSYLVGERGPEIFTPGASGAVDTNATLNRLTSAGQALGTLGDLGRFGAIRSGEGSAGVAPNAGDVAKATRSNSTTIHQGDKHVSVRVEAGGSDPQQQYREAERAVERILARMESDQRGSLSD